MQVRSVDDRIGIFELGQKFFSQRNPRHFLPGDGIAHQQRLGEDREFIDLVGNAQAFEHPEHIRPQLYAGADFLEFGCLLEQPNRDALLRKRQCGRETADAPAADDHRSLVRSFHSSPLQRRTRVVISPMPEIADRRIAQYTDGLYTAIRGLDEPCSWSPSTNDMA
jgi:hypothetical protein